MGSGEAMVMIQNPESNEPPTSKNIKVGVEGYEYVEIKEGLSEGDAILLMH
jgi:HlyD family secretion protein